MSIIAIDIGSVNTSVRVEDTNGNVILHDLLTPDDKHKWIYVLKPHFVSAEFIGIERQIQMNGKAVIIMKNVLYYLLELEKIGALRQDCKWGFINPRLKSPQSLHWKDYKLCEGCELKKRFHSSTNTKTWAVNVASHMLRERKEVHNHIFKAAKRDDLADTVLYCYMIRSFPNIITSCNSETVKRMIEKDIPEPPDFLIKRMTIAIM